MRAEDIKVGQEYLVRVTITEKEPDGNMLRAATCGEGEILQVHPDELIEEENAATLKRMVDTAEQVERAIDERAEARRIANPEKKEAVKNRLAALVCAFVGSGHAPHRKED